MAKGNICFVDVTAYVRYVETVWRYFCVVCNSKEGVRNFVAYDGTFWHSKSMSYGDDCTAYVPGLMPSRRQYLNTAHKLKQKGLCNKTLLVQQQEKCETNKNICISKMG